MTRHVSFAPLGCTSSGLVHHHWNTSLFTAVIHQLILNFRLHFIHEVSVTVLVLNQQMTTLSQDSVDPEIIMETDQTEMDTDSDSDAASDAMDTEDFLQEDPADQAAACPRFPFPALSLEPSTDRGYKSEFMVRKFWLPIETAQHFTTTRHTCFFRDLSE